MHVETFYIWKALYPHGEHTCIHMYIEAHICKHTIKYTCTYIYTPSHQRWHTLVLSVIKKIISPYIHTHANKQSNIRMHTSVCAGLHSPFTCNPYVMVVSPTLLLHTYIHSLHFTYISLHGASFAPSHATRT